MQKRTVRAYGSGWFFVCNLSIFIRNFSGTATLESSNPAVVTVTNTGELQAIAKGSAKISLIVNGVVYDTCKVKVTK